MEERLSEWILFQGSLGYALTHAQIRKLVRRMLGDDETLESAGPAGLLPEIHPFYYQALENPRKPC